MNKKELEALVDEQKETIDAKQTRIKELDEQVQAVQSILEHVFQLGITTRSQKRQWVRAYEKWLYSRYGQTISQLKIECNRLTYENLKLLTQLKKGWYEISNLEKQSEALRLQVESLKVQNEMD